MKIKKSTRLISIFKRVFNVRAWIDFDRIRAFTLYLATGFRRMFVPQRPNNQGESFKAAQLRLNLQDKDLKSKQNALYRLSILMCLAAIGIFSYSIYHLFYGTYRAVIVSLVLVLVALALAFRYHFWYFQIKERKLGCSIAQWYKEGLKGEKP